MEACHYEQNISEIAEDCTAGNNRGAEAIVLSDHEMHLAAFWARLLCGYDLNERFDPIFVMENIIPYFDNTYNYHIVEVSDWSHSDYMPAYYNPESNTIVIRSDVYAHALAGNAMDIITIAHEVVHCIQGIIMKFLNVMKCVDYKTEICKIDSEAMRNHEIQTDKLTNLICSPECLLEGKTDNEILRDYFVTPLLQFAVALTKVAGKEFLETLKDIKTIEKKEEEKCLV